LPRNRRRRNDQRAVRIPLLQLLSQRHARKRFSDGNCVQPDGARSFAGQLFQSRIRKPQPFTQFERYFPWLIPLISIRCKQQRSDRHQQAIEEIHEPGLRSAFSPYYTVRQGNPAPTAGIEGGEMEKVYYKRMRKAAFALPCAALLLFSASSAQQRAAIHANANFRTRFS